MTGARSRAFCFSALAALLLVCGWPASPFSDGRVLVRLDKIQPAIPAPDLVAGMEAVQEFDVAWLVRMPESSVSGLQQAGLGYTVFGAIPDGHVLFAVSNPGRSESSAALTAAGTVWPIDRYVSLLVTPYEDVRERIPADVHLKRVPDRIPLTPTFRLAGRAVAARRPSTVVRVAPKPVIAEMVSRVSAQALAGSIQSLEGFHTRYASLPSCEAAGTWLLDSFNAAGVAAERDSFAFSPYTSNNIVATLRGRTFPQQVIIVGAHYDSFSNDRTRLAPGADDNATGTAVVLELARVLAGSSFDYTIRFVAFSAEEWGLYGSRHYAQSARAAGEQIVGVVNLDMVGYTDRLPENLDLIVNDHSAWLADTFVSATTAYAPMPTVKVVNASFNRSDHASFWDQGYSALCGIEDADVSNPYYHKTTDTFATLNMDFTASVARGTLATVATLAQPYSWPPPPANLSVQGQVIGSMLMRARSAYLTWTAAPGAAGYHVYRATVSRGPYQRMTSAPVTATSFADRLVSSSAGYYYVVTSVAAGGSEGNYSQEGVLAGTGR